MTGLPFVFAAWVAVVPLQEGFIKRFVDANELGMLSLAELASENAGKVSYDLHHYFTQNIDYRLTEDKRKALHQFLSLCSTL